MSPLPESHTCSAANAADSSSVAANSSSVVADVLAVASQIDRLGVHVGQSAVVAAQAMLGRRFDVWMCGVEVDLLAKYGLQEYAPPGRSSIVFGMCRIISLDDTSCVMRWPTDMAELSLCNHWVPLIRTGEPTHPTPHPPCAGRRCSVGEMYCDSELRCQAAAHGYMVWPVPADGDCFWHALMVWLGRSSNTQTILSFRKRVAAWLSAKAHDPAWQEAILL